MTLGIALGGPELLIVLVIALLLFGGTQLPKLARSLGQAQKEFKKGIDGEAEVESGDSKGAS
jgi:sec-independent protein translocase protein TatA